MSAAIIEYGTPFNKTATGDVTTGDSALIGFYVNSTSAGTIVFRKGGSGGTVISGTITPAIGFHRFPASCPGGIHITVGGTLNVTMFAVEGQA